MLKDTHKRRAGKFRKVISVLTVILLLSSVLISCSKKVQDNETQTQQPADGSENVSGSSDSSVTTAPSGPPLTASGDTDWEEVLKQSTAVVYLTINPELALYVDSNNFVIYADYLNDDAKEAYSDINFYGKTVDECTKQVVEAAIDKEYLTDAKDVKVDIAVIDEAANSDALKKTTQETVSETAAQHDITVNVVTSELNEQGKILCPECYGSGKCIYCDTCPPCERCGGVGNLICNVCEEGYIICSNCGGNSETEQYITSVVTMDVEYCKVCGYKVSERDHLCPICNGSGKAPCHMCGGKGRTHCTECDGKGYGILDKTKEKVACGRCGGTGLKHCNECDGTGYEKGDCPIYCNHPGDKHEFRTEEVEMQVDNPNWCPFCQGQGKYPCDACKGNYSETCPVCEGTGITPCGMCMNEGVHQKGVCSMCWGTGYINPR
ncbi:MAG: hypothetical protein K6G45_03125 [Lachnospiraceae bacterium]|nr:hypothetical protein [Lachnospiraceae bacterium]